MLYFDTSFLTPLILQEATSAKVERFMAGLPAEELAISHWTRVEFSSLLAREVRMGGLKSQRTIKRDTFRAATAAHLRIDYPAGSLARI